MIKNSTFMESRQQRRRQESVLKNRFATAFLVLVVVICPWNVSQAQDATPAGICRFVLALPELEGPLTLGIFSSRGNLVRLLYKDAATLTIPTGLNGLIISWNGKDDDGVAVPKGTYRARGLVHGPLAVSALPQHREGDLSSGLPNELTAAGINAPPLFPSNRITVPSARDALLEEKRPLLAITARLQGNAVLVEAEGLLLFSLPLEEGRANPEVILRHGSEEGTAELILRSPEGSESYVLSGLAAMVPLNAGTLEMPADTLHSSPERVEEGASQP